MDKRRIALAVSLAPGLLAGSIELASAQTTAAKPGASGTSLEEVTVTAQRRSENLQKVPVTVSAFTSATLDQRQISSTIDLVHIIPNLLGHANTGTATANTYFMRGLGSTEQIPLLDPAVSTYIDDMILPRQNVNNYAMFDVERIEVLRGPQGTTFGRNSTGGAINVITRKPSDTFGGRIELGYGSFENRRARGYVNLPISDKLAVKVAGYYDDKEGWLKNITNGQKLNGTKSDGARIALRYTPMDTVTWDVAAEYMESNGVYARSILGQRDITRSKMSNTDDSDDLVADALANRGWRNNSNSEAVNSVLNWDLGWSKFTSLTNYRTTAQDFLLDFSLPTATVDPTPFNLTTHGIYHNVSQEFKLSGDIGTRFKYVGGAYYFYETNKTVAGQVLGVLNCSNGLFGDGNMTCNGRPGYSSLRWINNDTDSYAFFAQVDTTITDQLTAVVGARYTQETKTIDLLATKYGGITTANLKAAGIATSLKSDAVTPKFGLNFQYDSNTLFFVSATEGYKGGGWNSRTAYIPQTFQPMKPEYTWSYEAGVKTDLFDRKLQLNATGFLMDTKDLQLSYTTPGPLPGTSLSTQDNAGDIEVKGFELEAKARPIPELSLYGSLGYQTGEYTKVNPRARSFFLGTTYIRAIDPGNSLSRLPEFTSALGGSYTMPVAPLSSELSINAEAQYTASYWTTASNSRPDALTPAVFASSRASAYLLYNFGLGLETNDGKWRASLDCKNCTDKVYVTSVFNGIFYGDPRRVMFTIARKF